MKRAAFPIIVGFLLVGCKMGGDRDVGEAVVKAEDGAAPGSPAEIQIPTPPTSIWNLNEFGISGFEYWPWITGMGNPYSENRVKFGYDNSSSEAAKECTRLAYELLYRILSNPPEHLVKLRQDTDAPTRFFLWNNDYTKFNANYGATVYNWQNSYIKWQHYTSQDGKCYVPSRKSLDEFAKCEWQNKTQNLGWDCENSQMYEATTIDMTTQLPTASTP